MHEASYELAEGYEPTSEQIEAFRQGNAIFNCWTYFREYVQSSVARMNFPSVTVPFLRMVPKRLPINHAGHAGAIDTLSGGIAPPSEQLVPGEKKRRRR
jgi:hypothetical protein